jgi:hypothetical protein
MIENEITNKQLTPALGYVLTNKSETEFLKTIFLADGDSADNYHEVTIEYANTRIKEGGEKYVPNTLEEAKAQKIAGHHTRISRKIKFLTLKIRR